jgi:hypothetical protein
MPNDRAIDRFLEWLFERVEGVQHLYPGSLYRYQPRVHRGPEVTLSEGLVVRTKDPVVELHLDNDRVRELMEETGGGRRFAARFLHAGKEGLSEVARRAAEGSIADFVAITANTPGRFAPVARSLGYDLVELPRTRKYRTIAWIQRGVLKRYDPDSYARIPADSPELFPVEVWMSKEALLARYLQ